MLSKGKEEDIPPEILKKVRLLEISTRKVVNNIFAGEYHTVFKGQGMTFAEFRDYVPGDDVRAISWPMMAKTGKPYIKKFDEERELTMILAVDASGSHRFGSGELLKGEVVAQIAAVLAFSATRNNDNIGLLLFTDRVEHFVPPKKGHGHVHRLLRDLLYFKPQSRRTRLDVPLEYLLGVLKKRSTVFLLSDFQDQGFERSLRQLGRKHEVVSILVQDPMEKELPDMGLLAVEDPETGEILTIDTSSRFLRQDFAQKIQQQKMLRDRELRAAGVDLIEISTGEDFVIPLKTYFSGRHQS